MMQNRRLGSIDCDSCGVVNDGWYEPNQHESLAVGLKPANQRELMFFWLCGDCGPDYDYDPKQFFTEEFFDATPYCDRCEEESVDEWGHVCIECEDGVI
jgi:hypothetical protein